MAVRPKSSHLDKLYNARARICLYFLIIFFIEPFFIGNIFFRFTFCLLLLLAWNMIALGMDEDLNVANLVRRKIANDFPFLFVWIIMLVDFYICEKRALH